MGTVTRIEKHQRGIATILGAALVTLAQPATAQTSITVQADAGFRFIRCTDMFGTASCEFLSDQTDGLLRCVAFDAAQTPLATANTFANMAQAMFPNLDHRTIATVICRK